MYYEFLATGQTVNKELTVLRSLFEAVRCKLLELQGGKSWVIMGNLDNAPSQSAIIILEVLTQTSVNTVQQAPWSSDMAP
ncbi:hypothetical protein AVEN_189552-1, partial [Araneus ventricosus]